MKTHIPGEALNPRKKQSASNSPRANARGFPIQYETSRNAKINEKRENKNAEIQVRQNHKGVTTER
jgi:hypothetical protein